MYSGVQPNCTNHQPSHTHTSPTPTTTQTTRNDTASGYGRPHRHCLVDISTQLSKHGDDACVAVLRRDVQQGAAILHNTIPTPATSQAQDHHCQREQLISRQRRSAPCADDWRRRRCGRERKQRRRHLPDTRPQRPTTHQIPPVYDDSGKGVSFTNATSIHSQHHHICNTKLSS